MLEVEQLSFSYGRRRALERVSFDVAPGEIVALVGANGAGKSTLLRILACLLMQDSGSVRLDGVDPLSRPVRYRRGIGYLSEHVPLYQEMTVESYLTYRVRLKGERQLRVRRRVGETLEACGLLEQRQTQIRLLSLGTRKRLALADAWVMHPKVLLLDDPLAGLDPSFRRQVGAILTAASSRSAVLLAGHEVRELAQWCTRFVVLREGRIVGLYRVDEHSRAALPDRLERLVECGEDAGGAV